MAGFAPSLLEALLERDDDSIALEVRSLAESQGFDAALSTVTRFAVFAFAPAEHGRAALAGLDALATVSASQRRDALESQLVYLAQYAAHARRPWSEAPITEPPDVDADSGAIASLRDAIAFQDRLKAERWIAATILEPDAPFRTFEACTAVLPAGAWQDALRVTAAAWRIAREVPQHLWFGVLRIAAVQWVSEGGPPEPGAPVPSQMETPAEAAVRLITRFAEERGDPTILAGIEGLDAALFAENVAGSTVALQRMGVRPAAPTGAEQSFEVPAIPGTRPQVDFAGSLIATGIATRRSGEWPAAALALLCDTAFEAARSERWFEEWSI